MSEKIEEACMNLGEILSSGIAGMDRGGLRANVRDAKRLIDAVNAAHSEWFAAVKNEIAEQEAQEKAEDEALGLASSAAGKPGRKPLTAEQKALAAEERAAKKAAKQARRDALESAAEPKVLNA